MSPTHNLASAHADPLVRHPSAASVATPGTNPPPLRPQAAGLDLSRVRHDLRTPINHILGFCEMLQEEESLPPDFLPDLQRIHAGGRQLLGLITEYFDEETFTQKKLDLHRLSHELRTPVNHIVGYTELLAEQAEERRLDRLLQDFERIREAAHTWLGLMEEYLVTPGADAGHAALSADTLPEATELLPQGIGFSTPAPRSADPGRAERGNLLVVDDDPANRDMLARRLRRQGYQVTLADSGLEALRRLRAQPFDLVLLDLVMHGLDGYQVLTKIKSDPALAEIPVIMLSALDQENSIARCIEAGAEDYLAKPFNSVLLRARIGACLEKRFLRAKERQTYEALLRSQEHLATQLAEAAVYVRSLLPPPLEVPIQTRWCFHPSTQLGGDAFGYHWLGAEHFAFYLLDVCGHGVGAALLSVSILNVLRNQALPGVDGRHPTQVLTALNRAFTMEQQHQMFFTIWYGVYQPRTRQLHYGSGGHPPAVLFGPADQHPRSPLLLATAGPAVGCLEEASYPSAECSVAPGSTLFLFSDGVYEVARPNGTMWTLEAFAAALANDANPESMLTLVQELHGQPALEDDFSLVQFLFS